MIVTVMQLKWWCVTTTKSFGHHYVLDSSGHARQSFSNLSLLDNKSQELSQKSNFIYLAGHSGLEHLDFFLWSKSLNYSFSAKALEICRRFWIPPLHETLLILNQEKPLDRVWIWSMRWRSQWPLVLKCLLSLNKKPRL